jgi:hypothetical protein
MSDEDQRKDEAGAEQEAMIDAFLKHVQGVNENVANARWEEVKFHLDALDATAPSAPPSVRQFGEALKGFALGFQQFAMGKTEADKEVALNHLVEAKNVLRQVMTEHREFADNPGFIQMALGIEGQILSVQEQIARGRGETDRAALLGQQRDRLFDEMIAALEPGHPTRNYFEAIKLFQEALPNFANGMQSLVEMNLDLAQTYLQRSSKSINDMHDLLSKLEIAELTAQAGKNAAEGFGLLVSGQDAYVRVLRTAIIGDVNRSDVEALEKAEQDFVNGAGLINRAIQVMPGAFLGLENLGPAAALQARLIHNLRTLCERSLSPKAITATTAPKVVFYFVGTFVVLLIGLPLSGLVVRLQSTDIGVLLLVSLIVSVIGAFGFEATRLVPLFDVFSRMLPWAGKSGDAKPNAS